VVQGGCSGCSTDLPRGFFLITTFSFLGQELWSSIWSDLDSTASKKYFIELLFRPLICVHKDGEMLSKTTNCKHVVSGIPNTVRHHIKQFAFVSAGSVHLLERGIPDSGLSIFWTRNQELPIRWNRAADLEIFAHRAEESFFNSGTPIRIKLNQSNAVVSWVDKNLVCLVRMYNQVIDLVPFKFFVCYFEMVFGNYVPVSNRNVPYRDPTEWVTDKKSVVVTEDQTIWMYFVENCTFNSLLYLFLWAISSVLVVSYLYFRFWLQYQGKGFVI